MPRVLLSLAWVLVTVLGAAGGDWPQWRGPNRDGHAVAARLPTKLPDSAPAPTWKVKIDEGYAGAAVAGGKVFALARDDAKGTARAGHLGSSRAGRQSPDREGTGRPDVL
jgi:hypothetical protein